MFRFGVFTRKGLQFAGLFRLSSLILSVSWLMGCASDPSSTQELAEISPKLPLHFQSYGQWQMVSSPVDGESASAITPTQAWQTLPYPELVTLLKQLPKQNASLQSLHARYRAATASLTHALANKQPNLSLSATASHGSLSSSNSLTNQSLPTATLYGLSTNLNWEGDLWGKLDQQVQEKHALLTASQADWQAAILSTQVLAGQTFFHILALNQQQKLMQQIAQEQSRFIRLTQARYRAGIATRLDVAQAETQYHNSELQLLELRAQQQQSCVTLAKLSGQTSLDNLSLDCLSSQSTLSNLADTTRFPRAVIPSLIPSKALLQRPDVQAQLARVLAAKARLGYSQTAFLPTLSLTASVSSRRQDWQELFNLPNAIWSLGPSLAQTLFDGGKREAITQQAQADYEASIADYRQTLHAAFEEIEQHLTTVLMIEQALEIQDKTINSAKTALQIAQSQYRAGTVDAFIVINAQTQLWQAEKGRIDLWLRHWQSYLMLSKQIGSFY
jgi:NodT family efflux transporter outer membrane factor (OMF) lipoprotein